MTKFRRSTVAVLVSGVMVVGLFGCKKEGPAERAGREIDQAAEKAGKQMEKAGEKMQDTFKDMKK